MEANIKRKIENRKEYIMSPFLLKVLVTFWGNIDSE
jgi:hypothetical protein